MEKDDLKKFLAGVGITALVAGAGLSNAGTAWAA